MKRTFSEFIHDRKAVRNSAAALGIVTSTIGLWWLSPACSLVILGLIITAGAVIGMILDRPEAPQ